MTYLELIRGAEDKLDRGEITFGEYNEMIEPLRREIEHESKADVLDKIRAELEKNTEKWWYGTNSSDCFVKLSYVLEIIDKYRKSEGV